MLNPPDLKHSEIASRLRSAYAVSAREIAFLPLGADPNTAVYRIDADNGTPFFLKLRRGALPTGTVTVPQRLFSIVPGAVIPAIPTVSGALWTEIDKFNAVLYPFVHGRSGWETALSREQWLELGAALKALHSLVLPPELAGDVAQESYSSVWRDAVAAALRHVREYTFNDPAAARLARLLQEQSAAIRHIVKRAGQLAALLSRQPPENCLCHGDMHAGNVLIDVNDRLRIVDWDTLMLAPKERDLMFIGGAVGGVWRTEREVESFYQGYGAVAINRIALSYYRYERIVQDIGETWAEIQAAAGGTHSAELLELLVSQFEPGNVVEAALVTDRDLEGA